MKPFILAVASLLLVWTPAQSAPKVGLSVRLTSDRTSYSLGGEIQLEVVRENTGNSDLVIYRRCEWGASSKVRVFDSKGNEMRDVLYPIDDPPILGPSSFVNFVLLYPGESFGTRLQRPVRSLVKSTGDYEILVEYRSDLPDDLARKYIGRVDAPFWSPQRGKVISNRIKVRITQ